jgi:hypothetical protein
MSESSLPVWKRLLFAAVGVIGVPIAALTLLEGASSFLVLWRDLSLPAEEVRERRHTAYDTLLGWTSRPNFYDRDLYAPGVYLRTNAQGFRNDHVIAPRIPPGRVRAVCSGDSFTLGFGVDNEHSWCALLERKAPHLETVNMGQGGYGADQAYLWYKRDGRALNHDLQIFAVILDDFERMRRPDFLGFAKPVLRLDGDSLQLDNVPVPRWSYQSPRLTSYLFWQRRAIQQLRMNVLATRLSRRFGSEPPRHSATQDSAVWEVAHRMLKDLANLNRAKNSTLVIVLLPARSDWTDTQPDRWRRSLADAARRDGYLLVDLVDDFFRLPRDSFDLLFLDPHDRYSHYGNRGHEWVADRLYQRLLSFPETAALLKRAEVPPREDRGMSRSAGRR